LKNILIEQVPEKEKEKDGVASKATNLLAHSNSISSHKEQQSILDKIDKSV
jgi:hypothetical protein